MGPPWTVRQGQEGGGAVDQREAGIDEVGPHRHLPRVDPVSDEDPRGLPRPDPPAVLDRLLDRQPPSPRAGGRPPPSGAAPPPSTARAYSRTRYEPGVQTAIISSTSGRPSVGTRASSS